VISLRQLLVTGVGPVSHKFSKLTAHPWKNRWVMEQVFRQHQYAFDQWASTAEILARVAHRVAQGKEPLIAMRAPISAPRPSTSR